MSVFDLQTKTIRHPKWDKGDEVVIREPTYGESMKMAKACTGKDGELDNLKYSDMLLPVAIISWTFKKDGKEVLPNLDSIRDLPTSYVTFIAEEIGGFIVVADEEFLDETDAVSQR